MNLTEVEWRSDKLTTIREKARGAVRLQNLMLQIGAERELAREAARHEFAHAKADSGPGVFGLELNEIRPYYAWMGPRTDEEIIKIALAPKLEKVSRYNPEIAEEEVRLFRLLFNRLKII